LTSASKDQTLRLWDLREGRLLFTLQGHAGAVNACGFSADGNFIASGGLDKLVMIWRSNIAGVVSPEVEWGQGESLKTRPFPSASSIWLVYVHIIYYFIFIFSIL
jgi:WD40 repeat protein